MDPMAVVYEPADEASGSIKEGCRDELNNYQLLNEYPVTRLFD
jgi:hypothetical protein